MYEYLPIKLAKPGDLVECIYNDAGSFTAGKIYQVRKLKDHCGNLGIVVDDSGHKANGHKHEYFKLIKTKPMINAKVGDDVICVLPRVGTWIGAIDTLKPADKIHEGFVITNNTENGIYLDNFSVTHKVLCKVDQPIEKRNLAFYKRSGEPWTKEEYSNIKKYCGDSSKDTISEYEAKKFIFDNGDQDSFMYGWFGQSNHSNFQNCKPIIYEEIFPSSAPTLHVQGTTLGAWTKCTLESNNEQQTQHQKEPNMNELQQLLSTIFGAEKPATDYDKRPQLLVVVYSLDGKKVATATANSIEQVTAEVKHNPALWGCKVLTYKLSKELFVDVPVTVTKANIASEQEESHETYDTATLRA